MVYKAFGQNMENNKQKSKKGIKGSILPKLNVNPLKNKLNNIKSIQQ